MKHVYEIKNGETGETDHFLHTSMEKALDEARSLLTWRHDATRIEIDRFTTSGFAFGYDDDDNRKGWYAITRRPIL